MKSKFLIFITVLVLSLVGCAQEAEQTKEVIEEENQIEQNINEQPSITVWTEIGGKQALESSIEYYEAQHGIKINIEEKRTTEQRVKLEEANEKSYPDIIVLPHSEIGLAAKQELISPIEVKKEVKNRFYKSALQTMYYEGKFYGLPKNIDIPVFVYNTKFIKQAPKTLEELKENILVQKTEENYPFAFNWRNYENTSTLFNSFGSYVFGTKENAYNKKDIGLNNEGSEKALQTLNAWYDEGLLTAEKLNIKEELKNEKVYSAILNLSDYFKLKQVMPTLAVEVIPDISEDIKAKPFVKTQGWFVTNQSKNKEFALSFIEHMTTLDNSSFQSETTNEVVPIKALLSEESLLEETSEEVVKTKTLQDEEENSLNEENEEEIVQRGFREIVLEELENAVPYPNVPEMKDVIPQMNTAIRLTIEDKLDEKTALLYAVEELKILLKADY